MHCPPWHGSGHGDGQDDTHWTGAEIKSCCRLASLLDVSLIQAAQNVVPVAVTAGDKIEGDRSLKVFKQWFDVEHYDLVEDVGRGPIENDEGPEERAGFRSPPEKKRH
jgi:hypothetical protein